MRGAVPGDRVRARDRKVEALVGRGRARRAARAEPRPHRAGGAAPGRAVAGAPVRAAARGEGVAGPRRARAHRRVRGPAGGADRAGGGAAPLPQQARVLVRRGRAGRAGARLPPRGPLGPDRRRGGRHPRLGARSTRCARRSRHGAARRGSPRGTARPQTGVLRNLVVREGRRTGQIQARLVTSPGGEFRVAELAAATPSDSFLWTRAEGVAETTRGGDTEVVKGSPRASRRSCRACASGSRPTPSSRPTPRWRRRSTETRSSWPP